MGSSGNLTPLPPPAEQPPVPMETSEQSVPQESPPEETAPLCAAKVAMRGPPPSSSRPTSSMRSQPTACPTVPEDRELTLSLYTFQIQDTMCLATCGILTFQQPRIIQVSLGSIPSTCDDNEVTSQPNMHVTTRQWPVPALQHLRTEATFDNIAGSLNRTV